MRNNTFKKEKNFAINIILNLQNNPLTIGLNIDKSIQIN